METEELILEWMKNPELEAVWGKGSFWMTFYEFYKLHKDIPKNVEDFEIRRRENSCKYCDSPGGVETMRNQVCMPINGKVRSIDRCIHLIVAALNAAGISTVSCCCGHGTMDGRIDLQDGRVLIIKKDQEKHG